MINSLWKYSLSGKFQVKLISFFCLCKYLFIFNLCIFSLLLLLLLFFLGGGGGGRGIVQSCIFWKKMSLNSWKNNVCEK